MVWHLIFPTLLGCWCDRWRNWRMEYSSDLPWVITSLTKTEIKVWLKSRCAWEQKFMFFPFFSLLLLKNSLPHQLHRSWGQMFFNMSACANPRPTDLKYPRGRGRGGHSILKKNARKQHLDTHLNCFFSLFF